MPAVEAKLLENAFQEFAKASDSIINYYSVLESQIRQLKKEVDEKNTELEKARGYLYNILNSLPVGVVVKNTSNLIFVNKTAEELGSDVFLNKLMNNGQKSGELKNGKGHYRWKRERIVNGSTSNEVVVFEDVTEFEKMKERLERDERLMAMGEMAARMAHEIKNPLGSMELFLSMLLNTKLRQKDRKYIDYVLFGVKTIDRTINNLLSYTKPKTLAVTEGKLSQVVKETVDFMDLSARSRGITIEVNSSFSESCFFDPDLMKLVIMNFISNAIEAMNGDKGIITVDVKEDRKYAIIIINDNGVGMSEELRKNIFNPFFTTKDKGVGLGLYIVYNIIKAHGGYIEVESIEGSGSSFNIYIRKDSL
ncbi:MAG: PAS domain-containing sensor histidine kinase [Syntrophorhabdus sp.]